MTDSSKNPTLDYWLQTAGRSLRQAGIKSAQLDAEILASAVLNKPRTWLHAHGEHQLTSSEYEKLEQWVTRRLDHEPIAYIIGYKEFYGHKFLVSADVLVPRPESEAFLEVIKELEGHQHCLDTGTGSGALAICIALLHPDWQVTATDVSAEALAIAKRNAHRLKTGHVVFRKQNLLANDTANYDIIVANLPYVPQNVCNAVDLRHEPTIALDGGNDGLDYYRTLFEQVGQRNQKPETVLIESLLYQHQELEKMAQQQGYTLRDTKDLIQVFKI